MKIGTFSKPIKERQYTASWNSQVSHLHLYIDALKKLSEECGMLFKDFRDNEKGFLLFVKPFTADIYSSPTELQLEFIDIQNESDLKNSCHENDLLNFYHLYISKKKSQNCYIMKRRT